ncbi:hypothetical protein ACFPZI_00480 [Streptomyces chlorus]|uniref:Uncharacterized protein n=1 Tax=Streptomyces chlorus TaxID=887452 RepID=A0ABW1DP13_9ACTN
MAITGPPTASTTCRICRYSDGSAASSMPRSWCGHQQHRPSTHLAGPSRGRNSGNLLLQPAQHRLHHRQFHALRMELIQLPGQRE